jgi:hypothetical protein
MGTKYYQASIVDGDNRLLRNRLHFIGKMYWTSSEFVIGPNGMVETPTSCRHSTLKIY